MRVRDEPFNVQPPLGRRLLAIVVTTLAAPFIVVGGTVWWIVLTVLQRIIGWMMAFTVFLLIPAAVFAYHRDWNSAAQAGVIFLFVGAITVGVCCIVHRPADNGITVRFR
jgi:ABC-type transport system involved in multi-copper enzyme maturation permease subunit